MNAKDNKPVLTDKVMSTLALIQDGEALTIDNAAGDAIDYVIRTHEGKENAAQHMQLIKDLQYIQTMIRNLMPDEI